MNVREWHLASISDCPLVGRFSNRPFGVKRFQTIHREGVDVARGLVLLFGIGTKALPSWDSKARWNNLLGGLAVRLKAGPSDQANSPHPSSREGHHSTTRWSSKFPPMTFDLSRLKRTLTNTNLDLGLHALLRQLDKTLARSRTLLSASAMQKFGLPAQGRNLAPPPIVLRGLAAASEIFLAVTFGSRVTIPY
jgi:hypothetical protein